MPRKTVYNQITSDESIKQINPKNKELYSDFLDYLASVGRAPSTINGYRNDLEIFFCWNLEFNNNKFFIRFFCLMNTTGWTCGSKKLLAIRRK